MAGTAQAKTAKLSASLEDYLETISQICDHESGAHAAEIAERLGVKRPSVTAALRTLAARGLIHYRPYEIVRLTDKGRQAASGITRRHNALRRFFVEVLAVSGEEADAAACRMEHDMPAKVLQQLVRFVEFAEKCPRHAAGWIDGFRFYCDNGALRPECSECVATRTQ